MRLPVFLAVVAARACGTSGPPHPPAYLVYVRDHQGSVLAAIDDRGGKVWQQKQDAFGLRLESSGEPIPRGFLDQPFDEETGFYQFRYRTYDPATAQWLTPDPLLLEHPGQCIENPQACNPYAYAANRPAELIDPDGHWVDVHVVGTESYVNVTAGIVGPDAQRVAEALVAGANRFTGDTHVHVSVLVKVYESRADIPRSFTPIETNASLERSWVDTATSTVHIGKDGLGLSFDDLATFLAHEDGHAFGLADQYSSAKGHHSVSLLGHEDDMMGNFFKSVNPRFDPNLRQLLEHPALPRNQGLVAPDSCESPPGALFSGQYPGGIEIPPTVQ